MTLRCVFLFLISATSILDSLAAESESSSIRYESVEAALNSLKRDPNSSVTIHDDWTIIENSENGSMALWSFTPPSHPAHPAAIKRATIEEDGAVYIQMTALCEATKNECDKLIEQFSALNDQIRESMKAADSPASAQEVVHRRTFISNPK